MKQALFILDLDRCTGCAACVVACNNENPVDGDLSWRRIHTFNPQRLPAAPVFHLSLACNHCLEPACLAGCPANAYTKEAHTGAVLIDEDRCMGCRYCSWVCPYEAPQFNTGTGIMEKCTFCDHRQAEGTRRRARDSRARGLPGDRHRPGGADRRRSPPIGAGNDRRSSAEGSAGAF